MKTIFRIARVELSILFYSPVAWLVLIVFAIQSGIGFFDILQEQEGAQQIGHRLADLTHFLFGYGWDGIFQTVQTSLYLYLPLVTMGLISRELSSGSIKLLLSSPVSLVQIVLGKFLCMMIFGMLFIVILLFYCVGGFFSIDSLDTGFLFSGLFGIYLLICAYSAIGIFMSSLTAYQPIAAISTLAVFAFLNFVGTVWQDVNGLRDITYYLSITGRTNVFVNGLIISREFFYFFAIVLLFLCLTMLRLLSGREKKPLLVTISRYLLLSCAVVVFGYITSRPIFTWWFDATATKTQTLTPSTQTIIKQIKDPLTIHTYVSILGDYHYQAMPALQNTDYRYFDKYLRFMPDMDIQYHYYYDTTTDQYPYMLNPGLATKEVAKIMAESENFDFDALTPPAGIRKLFDVQKEEGRFVRELTAGSRSAMLRTFSQNDGRPEEQEIAAALKRLTTRAPRVAFITIHNTRSPLSIADDDYRSITIELRSKNALINQGFDVLTLSLDSADIPGDVTTIVIAAPTTAFSETVLQKITRYIDEGRNIIIAGEPGKQDIINPLLTSFGVRMIDGKLYAASKDLAPDLILSRFAGSATVLSPDMQLFINDSAVVSTPGAAGLTYSDTSSFAVTPLLQTDWRNVWNRYRPLDIDTGKVAYEPKKGDNKKVVPVALALSRTINNRQQRIIISGDADFMSNGELARTNIYTQNAAFTLALFSWLSNGEFPVDVTRPPTPDNRILTSAEEINTMRLFYLIVLPALILMAGAGILFTRARR